MFVAADRIRPCLVRVYASCGCGGKPSKTGSRSLGTTPCRAVGRNAKLKEQVTTIDFQARSVAALLHHPFRPILVGVDGRGTVKVYSHRHSAFVNSFHLADDKWPMSVVNMWQLNELQVHIHVLSWAPMYAFGAWQQDCVAVLHHVVINSASYQQHCAQAWLEPFWC